MDQQTQVPAAQTPRLPSAWSLFRPSMQAIRRNLWTFAGLFMVPLGGLILSALALLALVEFNAPTVPLVLAGIALALGTFTLCVFIMPALALTALRSVQGTNVGVEEMWRAGLPFVWRYFVVSLMLALLSTAGILLFIVPYAFVLKNFILAPYYLLNDDVGPIEAMRRSAHDAKRFNGAMWGVVGVIALISLADIVPFVGLAATVVAAVLYSAAPAIRYLQIREAKSKDKGGKPRGNKLQKEAKVTQHRAGDSTFAKQFDR